MAKGISLHIGLNAVNPAHYAGWSGPLNACEADAEDMVALAKAQGIQNATTLMTKQGTRTKVLGGIAKAAKMLKAGDLFFLTYSGHGGQLPDQNGDEKDGDDETWCLYDGELVDDELYSALGKFANGVRIVVLSDSCHSGSVVKDVALLASINTTDTVYRAMPDAVALRTYRQNRAFYDPILSKADTAKAQANIRANVLLISGCQDNQLSQDGTFNGLFTAMLLRVWNSGKFNGSYRQMHGAIVKQMPANQTPNLFLLGPSTSKFDTSKAFVV
jgi:metacaspase-1